MNGINEYSFAERPLSLSSPKSFEPAGFWCRVLAYFIDLSVIAIINGLILMFVSVVMGLFYFVFMSIGDGYILNAVSFLFSGLSVASYIVVFVFYYGFFYRHMGGTPGKLVMKLEVVDADCGLYLNYWRTLWRESVGKFVSTLIFCMGFIMIGLNRNKKGLHDLLFSTAVIRRKT